MIPAEDRAFLECATDLALDDTEAFEIVRKHHAPMLPQARRMERCRAIHAIAEALVCEGSKRYRERVAAALLEAG